MVIRVNEKYRIVSDPHCWIVQEYTGQDTNGQERWKYLTYHTDLEAAMVSLFKRRVRLIDSSVPDEILAALKQIHEETREVLKKFSELPA